jgi:hypothetical protein
MSEVATQAPNPATDSERKPPASGPETKEMLKRAAEGDQSCLPAVQALLADGDRGESYWEAFGSPTVWLRQNITKKAAGDNVLSKEANDQELDAISSELEGPNPTPIERLLAERASLCWFIVHWYENTYTNASGWSLNQALYQQRKIDKAHSRFLSEVRTLAQVRKLALPALQVNIGKNQVNVAETRP